MRNACKSSVRFTAVKTTSDVSPRVPGAVLPAVSTVVAGPPSIDTVAIPQMVHSTPSQLTVVPLNSTDSVAPPASELSAAPSLKMAISGPRRTHAPVTRTSGSCSSARVVAPGVFAGGAPGAGGDGDGAGSDGGASGGGGSGGGSSGGKSGGNGSGRICAQAGC
jgi:hypothetical protein